MWSSTLWSQAGTCPDSGKVNTEGEGCTLGKTFRLLGIMLNSLFILLAHFLDFGFIKIHDLVPETPEVSLSPKSE